MGVISVVLLSGGLDSCVVAAQAVAAGDVVHGITVHYGQSHATEVVAALAVAKHLGFETRVVSVGVSAFAGVGVAGMYQGGAGVVPGRNTVLLALALSAAERLGADRVLIGCNADDAADYPDCRREYIEAWSALPGIARVEAPLLGFTKREVVLLGRRLDAPLDTTVSCYRGAACGDCNACVLRSQAML